ncbi:PEP-CTERM sorting domain-containing protein [Nitrosococcus watsonii]|uniref:Ice-binding protein C-terminal domain-containing protein n=1 Tax=Nitrosococcus watsoni (strain C-113) TaxID=105559 RepID=D8K4C7_NITWC|nr:PEP-CTERM sorting domain-containing protein [Nitrosococcus watsonii]ADJ27824.1 protein of unknown function DUF1555 [Nitrosococcus watsonii C-113]
MLPNYDKKLIRRKLVICLFQGYSSGTLAALIEVSFSGNAEDSGGSIDFLPGETFSGSFIFDTGLAEISEPNSNAGIFQEIGNPRDGHSGLISANLTTSRGSVSFDRSDAPRSHDSIGLITEQIPLSTSAGKIGQTFLTWVTTGNQFRPNNYFSGSIDGNSSPFEIILTLDSIGDKDMFFSDPHHLLSLSLPPANPPGFPGGLHPPKFSGGLVSVRFQQGGATGLAFGNTDPFTISLVGNNGGSSGNGGSVSIPEPGTFALFFLGLVGLGVAGRKRTTLYLD